MRLRELCGKAATWIARAAIVSIIGLICLRVPLECGAAQTEIQKRAVAEDIFRDCYIPKLSLEISPRGIANLRMNSRTYVRATIREGTTVYTNVAIHLKGGPGSARPLEDFPAFTINFDHFSAGQTFHGLRKIHLNNSVQDQSFLSEKISRELFEAAGVPAPRAGNAKLTFNGRDLGVYVLIEGIDKQFLRRHFKDPDGNVYDGHSQTDVTDDLPTNSGKNRQDRRRLQALAVAARETDLNRRLSELEKTLDLGRFLSFMAMEAMLWHWDGYTMNRNNFRIFHDRANDRMVFLPQGVDQILSNPLGPIFPRTAGLVTRSVLEIPEGRRRYRERLAQLSTNVFNVGTISNRISAVAEKICAVFEEIDPRLAEGERRRARQLIQRFQQRANSIQRQISSTDSSKSREVLLGPLTDFQARIDQGRPRFTREQTPRAKMLLHISAKDACAASWRSRLTVENGQYRLEVNAKTQGVVFNPKDAQSGAGLRISGRRLSRKISGDSDWSTLVFDFGVDEDETEIEIVCELRAARGDVWFDLDSMKLKRR